MSQRTCGFCGTSIDHRTMRAIYCSKPCSVKASHQRDPSLRKRHQARYRGTAKGKAAKKTYRVERTCVTCSMVWLTENRKGKYCSFICRDFDKWGPRFSAWPRVEREPRPPKPKKPPYVPTQRACAWCENSFLAVTPTKLYCCHGHKKKRQRAQRRGAAAGARGTYTWAELTRRWIDIGKTCAYCAEAKRNDEIEPDHVIPLSKGGSNSIHNVVPACSPCNSDKRDLLLDDWYVDRERRGLPARRLNPLITHLVETLAA